MIRHCVHCKGDITACFGFTFARDLDRHNRGIRFARELCGRCMTILDAPGILRACGDPVFPELQAMSDAIRKHYAIPDPLCPELDVFAC